MEVVSQENKPATPAKRFPRAMMAGILLVALAGGFWSWHNQGVAPETKDTKAVKVVSTAVVQRDVPARLTANGTVSALQTVEIRPQLSATIKAVHIKEGQFVRKGDKLFTLDARTEDANLSKTEAQLVKSGADLLNAERNLERQRELFRQKFISQAALDVAQNQVDSLRGQLGIDQAAARAARVTRGFSEIVAPIAGRTGVIPVYPGSLVQPNGAALVSITQIDPINVSFTLPERELAVLQQALAQGEIAVDAQFAQSGQPPQNGRLIFVDNAVDAASGTIRLKAQFPNADNRLWPGMFVTVRLAPRLLAGAPTVPVQAVQTGPERKFLYVIGQDHKVAAVPVKVHLVQDGYAVIEGVAPGTRVVVEGAQNLRPGSAVTEAAGQADIPGKDADKTNTAARRGNPGER